MLNYARDRKDIIHAKEALKGRDYVCIACGALVRLRYGIIKKPHFFHINTNPKCPSYDLTHFHLQAYIKKLLPPNEIQLEVPFPKISRTADIFWVTQKIVFEVQCSPISLKETKQRILDYKKVGCEVIWILHDKKFNKIRLTPVENYLRKHTFFYAHFSAFNQMIYDQFDICRGKKRLYSSRRFRVDLSSIRSIKTNHSLPTILQQRKENSPFCFKGDLLYKAFFQDQASLFKEFCHRERKKHRWFKKLIRLAFPRAEQERPSLQKNRGRRRGRARRAPRF